MQAPDPPFSREILNRLLSDPPSDPKTQNHLAALRDAMDREEQEAETSRKLLAEYEEAYAKLTAPAQRVGTFLEHLGEGRALVQLGDGTFVAERDPKLKAEALARGVKVALNEAYAIVDVLAPDTGGTVERVGEALEDGRLRLKGNAPGADGGRLVLRAATLADTLIRAGDEVRCDAAGRMALEHFPRTETKEYFFEEIPEIPWEAVGGQDAAIRLIRETIEQPLLHAEIYAKYDKKPIKGILLYGPPGCGKTLLGKATAHNLAKEYGKSLGRPVKEYFMAISGPKILNMWLGETERIVREIFETARRKAKEGHLVFIFMDEAESVLRTRSSGRYLNISNTVVPQFCAELDGLVSLENVVLMLTSNRPDYIDPAVLRPERIDRKVKVARPDKAASTQILAIYLHDRLPLDPAVLKENHGEVDCARKQLIEGTIDFLWRQAKDTEFLRVSLRSGTSDTLYWKDLVSGALLKSVVDRAKDSAIRRAIAEPSGDTGVTQQDLHDAVRAEYQENEIFPKGDVQEDWLLLLDHERDAVASVRPIAPNRGEEIARKGVI